MRINRRFLYVGLFLVAIGGVLVAADLVAVSAAGLLSALRLWPLAIVAIGLSIVLRRTQYSLPAGMLAAAVPGLVLGGALAVVPRFAGDCGAAGESASGATAEGTFDGPATVSLRGGCGSITVVTAPGNAWRLVAANSLGRAPSVTDDAQSLSIDAVGSDDMHFLDGGRDSLELTLPTSEIESLTLVAYAGTSRVHLPGGRIDRLALTANASSMILDASAASIAEMSGVVNVGLMSIRLPTQTDFVGSVRLGGGKLELCSPPGLGLRVTTKGTPREVMVDGVEQTDSAERHSLGRGFLVPLPAPSCSRRSIQPPGTRTRRSASDWSLASRPSRRSSPSSRPGSRSSSRGLAWS